MAAAGEREGGGGGGGAMMRSLALLARLPSQWRRFLGRGSAAAVIETMQPHFARYRWHLVTVLALLPVSAAMAALVPFLMKVAVDDYLLPAVAAGEIGPWREPLIGLVGLAAAVVAAGYLADALYVRILQRVGHQLLAALRETVYRRTLRLPRSYFDRNPIGSVLTRVTSDVEALGESLAGHALSLVADLIKTVAFLAMMFWLSWKATPGPARHAPRAAVRDALLSAPGAAVLPVGAARAVGGDRVPAGVPGGGEDGATLCGGGEGAGRVRAAQPPLLHGAEHLQLLRRDALPP